jgi:integrase
MAGSDHRCPFSHPDGVAVRRGIVLALGRHRPSTKDSEASRYENWSFLSRAACDVLLAAEDQSNVLVFRATRGGADVVLSSFKKLFKKILKLAELPEDITPHTLRHSFISVAADLALSEPTIAALVGHKGRSVTSRYIHSADAVLLAAADVVAKSSGSWASETTLQTCSILDGQ